MSLYTQRGVSAQKEDVHDAIKNLDKGLFKNSFCKVFPDFISGNDEWVNIMHADGAGTKSILAYLYWKETGDMNVWKGIAQDAIVMNLDDMLCTGVYDNFLFSSTIDRNKSVISGDVIEQIINGTQEFFDELKKFDINIHYMGGETADVGDVVRTIAVNGTMMARWPKDKIITNEKIKAGNVIVAFASDGQSTYEKEYNSGIGSNGLTSARHDVLNKYFAEKYPETFEPSLKEEVIYIGKYNIRDKIRFADQRETPPLSGQARNEKRETTIGKLLLSPTRTYAPLMKVLLQEYFEKIHGAVHCSGGGQTKCMKYLPESFTIIKDDLFEPPLIFKLIQQGTGTDDKEMYQVFNMGHRLEIFTEENSAQKMIDAAKQFNIEAKIVGRVEENKKKELKLFVNNKWITF
ncbi:MAG: AIR synthase-related protein [Parafilimonas sp.]